MSARITVMAAPTATTPLIAVVLLLAGSLPVDAQTVIERPVRRIEITVAGGLMGGTPLGRANATIRSPTQSPFRLFTTDTQLASAPAVELRVGTAVIRRVEVELRGAFLRPELQTAVSDDVENAAPLTVTGRIDQYMVEAGVLVLFDELRIARMVPFATGGAGYLRQLQDRLVVEEGRLYHVGGGVKHWLFTRPRGALQAAGLRADGRVYVVRGGFGVDDEARRHLAATGGFFMVF